MTWVRLMSGGFVELAVSGRQSGAGALAGEDKVEMRAGNTEGLGVGGDAGE